MPPANHNAGRRSRRAGAALLAAGALLLAAAGAYYGYGLLAERAFDDVVADNPGATDILPPAPTPTPTAPPSPGGESAPTPTPAAPEPGLASLYPGSLLPARQWADPRGTISLAQPDLAGFTPLSSVGQPLINGLVGQAERMIIPQLAVDSDVQELSILNLASSSAFATPKFVVGHIPATPNPGSTGNGWYFGHLESPVEGEGNVFASLPRVADLLRDGEDVHVVLTASGRDYLYAVSSVDLLHQSEMGLYDSDDARVTLVTCYPRLHYDHRLLVTAHLIGFRDAAA